MGSLKPAKKAATPPPEPEPEEEAPAASSDVQPNGLPAGIDIAALLGQLKGGSPAPPPPAPEPEPAAPEVGDDMASVLSSLGLVQLSSGNQVKFDPNSKNGKDKDGFDDEIFI